MAHSPQKHLVGSLQCLLMLQVMLFGLACSSDKQKDCDDCAIIGYGTPDLPSPGQVEIVVGRVEHQDEYLNSWFPLPGQRYNRYVQYPRYAIDFSNTFGASNATLTHIDLYSNGFHVLRRLPKQLEPSWDDKGVLWKTIWVDDRTILERGASFLRFHYTYRNGQQPPEQSHVDLPLPTIAFKDGINALSLAHIDNVLWVGSSHRGLYGLRKTDETVQFVHYPGNSIGETQSPEYQGPQGNMITRIVRSDDGLWMGSYYRGLTWFSPGADPFSKADDRWAHYTIPWNSNLCSEQFTEDESLAGVLACGFAETFRDNVTAIALHGRLGIWVGTQNGLFYLATPLGAEKGVWSERIADGVVLSLADNQNGTLWVGFTTEVDPNDSQVAAKLLGYDISFNAVTDRVWPQAKAPLLQLAYGDRPGSPDHHTHKWYWPTPSGFTANISDDAPAGTAFALLLDQETLWVGTGNGLAVRHSNSSELWHRFTDGAGPLFDSDILTLARGRDHRIYLGAFDFCGKDGGALMILEHNGTPLDPNDDRWTTYTRRDGIDGANISAIAPLSDNRVAFTSFNLSLSMFSSLGLRKTSTKEGCDWWENAKTDGSLTLLDFGPSLFDKSDDEQFQF